MNRGRRSSMRVHCGLSVTVLSKDGRFPATIQNISQKGLFIAPEGVGARAAIDLSGALPPGAEVSLTLHFGGDPRPVRLRSQVAWKSDLGIGLEFIAAPERLREFVSDLAETNGAASVMNELREVTIDAQEH